jgi:chemotaxis protein histidine kinase CheA
MSMQDDETLQMYLEESREHLADIETDLLAIEEGGADIDETLVNKVYRAAHSIKGGAGFMGLSSIKDLTHEMENILGKIRSREMVPNPEIVNILLLASDALREMINDVEASNERRYLRACPGAPGHCRRAARSGSGSGGPRLGTEAAPEEQPAPAKLPGSDRGGIIPAEPPERQPLSNFRKQPVAEAREAGQVPLPCRAGSGNGCWPKDQTSGSTWSKRWKAPELILASNPGDRNRGPTDGNSPGPLVLPVCGPLLHDPQAGRHQCAVQH